MSLRILHALLMLLGVGASSTVLAADPAKMEALELMPASTVAYFEIAAPQKLIDTVLDHPLMKELENQPDYQAALESPDMQELRKVLTIVEDKLGTKWRPALTTLSGDGVHVGVDLATQGVVLLAKSRDPKLLEKTRDTFIELARADAKDKGQEDPIKLEEYRGVTAYRIEDVYYATHGPWLILTNKALLGKMVLDNAFDAGPGNLRDEKQFQQALKAKVGQPTLWTYTDLTILRATGIANAIFKQKSDNPGAEILLGGILAALPDAPFVTASVDIEANRVKFTTAIPYDAKSVAKSREFYFGTEGKGAAPALLEPKDTILSLSTYRDFASMWRHAPDLFNDDVNAQFAEAESGLTTIFSGRSFGDDILGNLEPGMQLVVTRQSYAADDVEPQIKLPAIATVFRMKNPEETARQFKITYQSLIGFANVAGGQAKLEPLDQDSEKIGGIMLVAAKYLPPTDAAQKKSAGIHFNASPTVAFVGDKFIFSSTRALALELAQQFEKQTPPDLVGTNTKLKINGVNVLRALDENRQQLIAQNMLEKGHDQAAAETEIGLLLNLLKSFHETSLSLNNDNDTLRLSWELQLESGK